MSNTVLEVFLSFPMSQYLEDQFEELYKACGSTEAVEEAFDIEFSCGDGLYLSDIEDDALVDRYDGKVCTDSLPRHRLDGKEFVRNKVYQFLIKYLEKNEELVYYLNSREMSRKPCY